MDFPGMVWISVQLSLLLIMIDSVNFDTNNSHVDGNVLNGPKIAPVIPYINEMDTSTGRY